MIRKNILFVCTGNTCRSPMAESLARKNAGFWRFLYRFQSAGTNTENGQPASPHAVAVMGKDYGIDLSGHKSQVLTPKLIKKASKIFTMTQSHMDKVLKLSPEAKSKTQLLSPTGVPDPFGGSEETYRKTAKAMNDLIQASRKV